MRTWILILLLLGSVLPALGAKPVTVEQLEQIVTSSKAKTDADMSRQIANLQLTERLSSARASELQSDLPGEKSRAALRILADESEFLDPPTTEIPSAPAPDLAEQRRIMGLVADYVAKTIPQLPNFFATRNTARFEDTPQLQFSDRPFIPYEPMHFVGRSQETVLYRGGREVVDVSAEKKKSQPAASGLTTWGVFGPILGSVLVDAARSKLEWSHWEQGPGGLAAVFDFDVPRDKSSYEVNYCCMATESATPVANLHAFRRLVGYRGSMTVDPSNGAILRLVLRADLKPADPVTRAEVLVEYGPVEIGGRSYLCPVRSLSSTLAQTVQLDPVYKYPLANQIQPLRAALNEVAFENYHVFRSDARVLTAEEAGLVRQTPHAAGVAASSPAAGASSQESANGNHLGVETNSPAGAPTGTAAATEPSSGAPSASSAAREAIAPAAKAETPEISMTAANGFPDLPVEARPGESPSGITLRTTSRLVDVSVVAFDKYGRPITDLKPGDFEIYDNGRKQRVSFFSQATTEGPRTSPIPLHAGQEPEWPKFSNQRDATVAINSSTGRGANSTILLIDASNIAFGDLTYARGEMLRFLKTVPAEERVGLYVLRRYGFQILMEPTADHAQVASTLAAWMPSSQDLARAQDEEQRNRRQFDWVHRTSDLAYVNGNGEGGNDPEMYSYGGGNSYAPPDLPPDAKLKAMGSAPERDALFLLQAIARNLAAIPGHKTLVWISSDNVLADWSSQAAAKEDQGSKFLDPLAMHTREALNEAHVSIYPLDASQLEAGGIAADIGTRNILAIGKSDRDKATAAMGDAAPGMKPGRETAKMQQDTHPIQPMFRELAEATGGRPLRRAGDIAAELDSIVADGRAAYMLSFTPDTPADDTYHHITVKLAHRSDSTLRYRTGYLYAKEPVTMKERIQRAIWQPADVGEIALTAGTSGFNKTRTLRLNVAATDLALAQQGDSWVDQLDIFLIERDDAALHAKLSGQTLALRLRPATYQRILKEGLDVDEPIPAAPESGALRVLVIDQNTGRMGSVTVPASALANAK